MPGMNVPRHTHTGEDETYFVLAVELEVIVGDETVLKAGDTLMAPRDIPHALRNSDTIQSAICSPSHRPGLKSSWLLRRFLRRTRRPRPPSRPQPPCGKFTSLPTDLAFASAKLLISLTLGRSRSPFITPV